MPDNTPVRKVVEDDLRKILPYNQRANELYITGTQHHHSGNVEAARLHYLAALHIEPKHPYVLQNLSAALTFMDKYEMAYSIARRAIKVQPDNWFSLSNYGIAACHLGNYDEAREVMEKVLSHIGDNASLWHNYGLVHYMDGNTAESLKAFTKSLDLDPNNNVVKFDHALSLLGLQKIDEGLKCFESRWHKIYQSPISEMGIAEWQGEDLNGKNIIVHHEQGFGDSLMFCRYLKALYSQGATVTVTVPPELIELFSHNFPHVHVIDWKDEKIRPEDYDFHSPLMSVWRWLRYQGNKGFGPHKYLTADKTDVKLPIENKIGICWASGDHGPALRRRRRHVPLELFIPMTEIDGIRLISLQKGGAEKRIVDLGLESIIFDPMAMIEDFYGTAKLINELDAVVSVDSAVAHLAAAMGKPVIMLGPYTRCWRWWGENNGTPWYDNFLIEKQSRDGTWKDAMFNVTQLILEGAKSWQR